MTTEFVQRASNANSFEEKVIFYDGVFAAANRNMRQLPSQSPIECYFTAQKDLSVLICKKGMLVQTTKTMTTSKL